MFNNKNIDFYLLVKKPFNYYSNTIIYQLDSIGVSTNENIPIYAVKLSVNANIEQNQPKILLLGQCHAEEIYGIEISMALINCFLNFIL